MRRLIALWLAALALAVPAPARADTTRTETYVAGFAGDADGPCRTDPTNPTGVNIGSVCFGNLGGFRSVYVDVNDQAPWLVGYWIGFLRPDRSSMGGTFGCKATPEYRAIPPGAATLLVYITGPVLGPLECLGRSSPGVGTVGSVVATLRTTL